MKQKQIYKLDKGDYKAIELFNKLGMPRNLAKTLMYVSQVDECCSIEIEQGADLRQPEVSTAINELRKKGWISKRDMHKKGRGRPVHIYKPKKDFSEIWKNFEQEKLKEVESVEKEMSQLKGILETR